MKVLAVYFTQTGNTQKIAETIYGEIRSQEIDADLKRVNDITSEEFSGYDRVSLGSACHSSDLAEPVKRLLAEITTSPALKLAGFVTHATMMLAGGNRQSFQIHNSLGKETQ